MYVDAAGGGLTRKKPIIDVFKPGGVAQLGEHLPCKQGVASSNLAVSTNLEVHNSHTYM